MDERYVTSRDRWMCPPSDRRERRNDATTTTTGEGRRTVRTKGNIMRDDGNVCERLEHQLRQLETRVASEKRAVEASEDAIAKAELELERERREREENTERLGALERELAEAEEVLRAEERQARAGMEAEREALEQLELAREKKAAERLKRLDDARRAIENEEAMRRAMLDQLTLMRLSDEIRELSAHFGGPWVEPDLSDVPEELLDAVRKLVRARRENEAMREDLLARGAEKMTDE